MILMAETSEQRGMKLSVNPLIRTHIQVCYLKQSVYIIGLSVSPTVKNSWYHPVK